MYCSLADLRQMLPGMGTEPGDDAILKRLIEEAQVIVERETGKVFEARNDTTRTLHAIDDVDGKTLYLRASLAQLAASSAVTNGDGLPVSSNQYTLWPSDGPPYRRLVLKQNATVAWTYTGDPENAISVTGRWADYVTPPANIRTATRSIAAWLYKRRDSMGLGDVDLASQTQQGVLLLPPTLPRDVRVILDEYTDKPGAGSRVVRGKLVK